MNQVGFPSELKNEIDYSLPAGVESYSVKVTPSNLSSFTTPTTTTSTASGSVNQLLGANTNVIFDIPAGQGNTFIDPRYSNITFRVKYEVVSGGGGTNILPDSYLRSNAMAHFDRAWLESQSGVVLDDVNLFGLVNDVVNSTTYGSADRDSLSLMWGWDTEASSANAVNNNQGHKINNWSRDTAGSLTAGSSYYSYCCPLLNSLIGQGATKFFAIGKTQKLRLNLTSAQYIPVTVIMGTAGTTPAGAQLRITIDNISLNLQYINLPDESMRMLNKTGIQYYNGITYRCSSATTPAVSGNISLLTGIRGSSVRSLITRCSENVISSDGCANGMYDSKLPPASAISYNINGMQVPSNPVDLIHNPALAFNFLQESNPSFNSYEFKSSMTPERYCVVLAPTGSLPSDVDSRISSSTTSADTLAQFEFGYNLEKVSKAGILDGMNLNAGQTFLNVNLYYQPTNSMTYYFIAKQDIIYVHDYNTGEITVRI